MSQSVSMVCYHPCPSEVQKSIDFNERMKSVLAVCTAFHYPMIVGASFQFPERRLVQYDCGESFSMKILSVILVIPIPHFILLIMIDIRFKKLICLLAELK